jgi:hypothetical protein
MATTSLARSAQEESPEQMVGCFRHEGEGCPRCDGAGYRKHRRCVECGEAPGSVSEGTGCPLIREWHGDGRHYHVRCLPGTRELDVVWSGPARMNS